MNVAQRKTAGFAVLALIAGFALGKLAIGALTGPNDTPSSQQAENSTGLQSRPSLLGSKTPKKPVRRKIPSALKGVLAEEASWFDKVENATLSSLPSLFAEAEQIEGKSFRDQVRLLLLIRWLELDPEDAYAAARQRKEASAAAGKTDSFDNVLREFFRVWSRVDLDAALAAAAALEDPAESKAAYQAVARGRVDVDEPLDYLELVKSLPDGAASSDLYASALTRLAEINRELAITEAIGLPWSPRIGSLNALYAQWSVDDPHAALEATARLAGIGLPIHDRAIAAVLPELAKVDPDLAGDRYSKLHDPNLNRIQILRSIVDTLAEQNPVGAAEWLGKHGKSASANAVVIGDLLNRTLLTDPAAAIEIYNAVQFDGASTHIKLQPLGDPSSALNSLASLPDSFGKEQLQSRLISQWSSSDFHAAAAYAEGLPPGPHLYQNPSDLNAAWDHASARRGELSDGILNNLLRTIADADPDLAIRKFQTLPSGEFRDSTGRNLTATLARSSPFKAAEFISTLPAGDLRNGAIRTVANSFAADDPFAASDWIAKFPAGNDRDIASIELVNVVQQFDPQSAFIWAADIGDENRRRQSVDKVVRSWSRTDPAAAAAQIRASAIPDARKTKLLKILGAN